MINEKEILSKIINGDKTAYEYIYKEYYSPLTKFASGFIYNDAESVVQDTLIKIWEKRDTLIDVISLKSYLYRSVKNACLNILKRQQIHDRYMSEAAYQLKLIELEAVFVASEDERTNQINILLEQMPEQRKKVFLMNTAEGMKAKEISELLNISERTVHTHVYKAMKFLKSNLFILIIGIIIGCFNFFQHKLT